MPPQSYIMRERELTPAVFFDRDGIVNVSPGAGYVTAWDDFHVMPGFPGVLKQVKGCGYLAIIVTNQRCVAIGKLPEATLIDMHIKLRNQLQSEWAVDVDDILYCPHDRDEGCLCRKPLPGMLLDAARRHGIDLQRSWMIGDQPRDIAAGSAAGCQTILVGDKRTGIAAGADYCVSDMEELSVLLGRVLKTGEGE